MSGEGQSSDKKSLRVISGDTPDFHELARDCVAFANARGGSLLIGIEDDDDSPPAGQKVNNSLVDALNKRIPQLTHNVNIAPRKAAAENGGEYIELQVFHNTQGIAATSDGRYYIRVADETRKLLPDELSRLMNDKNAFVWEAQTSQQVPRVRFDEDKLRQFLSMIRASDRVSSFIKEKSDDEVLAHYLFVKDDYLTNLGVLWIGRREDRATLQHAPAIQFIKYDETERKVNKITWDDFYLNPYELIEAVWTQVPDWRESYELPDGLFRKSVPHYPERVIRELLANALVHRPYTQKGDIFLNLFPDRLEVHNPGLLPLGVTPRNILHQSVARNIHLAQVFRDLKLMEKEGSGYDMMYDVLLSSGKQIPKVVEGNDRVTVTIQKQIVKPEIVDFVAKADETFHLTQKERVTLGLLAQYESLTISELAGILELREASEAHHWLGRLPGLSIVKDKGKTKGKAYFVEPEVLRKLNFKGTTTLKTIEKHRLRELIFRDLEIYKEASIGEIHQRIGSEIPVRKVYRELQELVSEGKIEQKGDKRGRRYFIDQNH
jgi:ATP-dependent DNA helicase RecG